MDRADREALCAWVADDAGVSRSRPHPPTWMPERPRASSSACATRTPRSDIADTLEASASSRTPTCSTPGSARPSGPSRTLGWPDPATAALDPGQRPLAATDGRPEDALTYYYPGSCLVTARDIITLWVARMVIIGLYLLGDVPFTATASSTPTSRTARASG